MAVTNHQAETERLQRSLQQSGIKILRALPIPPDFPPSSESISDLRELADQLSKSASSISKYCDNALFKQNELETLESLQPPQPTPLDLSQASGKLLKALKSSIDSLALQGRAKKLISNWPVLIHRDDRPSSIRDRLNSIGELVQLAQYELEAVDGVGPTTIDHITEKLELKDPLLRLGTYFTNDDISKMECSRVSCGYEAYQTGFVPQLAEGKFLNYSEAKKFLQTKLCEKTVSFVGSVPLRDESTSTVREPITLADAIQLRISPNDLPWGKERRIFLSSMFRLGLCFGMKLEDDQLKELEIPRVTCLSDISPEDPD